MNRANNELLETLFAILGGVGGTLATAGLARLGIPLPAAAGGVAIMAGLTAASARGRLQAAAMGALAGSAAQLVAHWHAAIARRLQREEPAVVEEPPPQPQQPPSPPPRQRRVRRLAKPAPIAQRTEPPQPEPTEPQKPDDGPLIIKEPIGGVRLSPDLEAR
jgi:hypothetical protein